jgi:putative ABC transport system substrate-binding protein
MRRREFITLLGGAAVAWPLVAHAQQSERIRRIGVLMSYPESDPEGQLRATEFRRGLEKVGWAAGRNLQIDYHWGTGDADWIRSTAAQLLQLAPDVILANGDAAAKTVQQSIRTIPVIFIVGGDAEGLVQSYRRPGGNLTGFSVFEASLGAKLLELLKEIAPRVSHVAILINPDNAGSQSFSASAVAAAPRFAVEVVVAPVRKSTEIEAAMTQRGRESDYGLIVPPDPATNSHRKLIIELAARHRLPAIFYSRAATVDADSCPTASISPMCFDRRQLMPIASSRARNRLIYRCNCPLSSSWRSTSRPPRHSGSPYQTSCSPPPTR